jgi:hypothetical protein
VQLAASGEPTPLHNHVGDYKIKLNGGGRKTTTLPCLQPSLSRSRLVWFGHVNF